VLVIYEVSTDGITGTVADPGLILTAALKANAVSIALCHNHSSGETRPSSQDEELISKNQKWCTVFNHQSKRSYYYHFKSYFSFVDKGCYSPSL
jgi:DNA repair protein RadC